MTKQKDQSRGRRQARFRVNKVEGATWAEASQRWHSISRQCQQISNHFFRHWLVWHTINGSDDKLRKWLADRAEFRKFAEAVRDRARRELGGRALKKKDEPLCESIARDMKCLPAYAHKLAHAAVHSPDQATKLAGECPVDAMPDEITKGHYRDVADHYPDVNRRVISLTQQALLRTLLSRKAVKGALPGHTAILLGNEGVPQFTKPVPIRFDKQIGKLFADERGRGIRITLERTHAESNLGKGENQLYCLIYDKGKKVQSQVAIFDRIVSGEYGFHGSALRWDDRRRQWHLLVTYSFPLEEPKGLNFEKWASLIPHATHPVSLILPGERRRLWPAGPCSFLGLVRQRLEIYRRSRSQAYRYASPSRKGHGRRRNDAWRVKAGDSWANLTKRINSQIAADTLKTLLARGIGNLVYFKPSGEFGETRYLHTAGRSPDSVTSWPWQQIETELARRCTEKRINFMVRPLEDAVGVEKEDAA